MQGRHAKNTQGGQSFRERARTAAQQASKKGSTVSFADTFRETRGNGRRRQRPDSKPRKPRKPIWKGVVACLLAAVLVAGGCMITAATVTVEQVDKAKVKAYAEALGLLNGCLRVSEPFVTAVRR